MLMLMLIVLRLLLWIHISPLRKHVTMIVTLMICSTMTIAEMVLILMMMNLCLNQTLQKVITLTAHQSVIALTAALLCVVHMV
jgi:hypothetical protein